MPRWAEKIWGTPEASGGSPWGSEPQRLTAAAGSQAELAFAEPDLATSSLSFISQVLKPDAEPVQAVPSLCSTSPGAFIMDPRRLPCLDRTEKRGGEDGLWWSWRCLVTCG